MRFSTFELGKLRLSDVFDVNRVHSEQLISISRATSSGLVTRGNFRDLILRRGQEINENYLIASIKNSNGTNTSKRILENLFQSFIDLTSLYFHSLRAKKITTNIDLYDVGKVTDRSPQSVKKHRKHSTFFINRITHLEIIRQD